MYFSSKINHFISFPLTGLDMKPFLVKGTEYDVNLCKVLTYVSCVVVESSMLLIYGNISRHQDTHPWFS